MISLFLTRAFIICLIPLFMGVSSSTVYLHRSATHGSVVFTRGWRLIFRFMQWLSTGIFEWEWVPVHRKHHRHTDQEGDVHSPLLEGFWHIQLGNVLYYKKAVKELTPEDLKTFGVREPEDWFDRHLFNNGGLGLFCGTSILVAICCLLWGFQGVGIGLTAAFMHMVAYMLVLTPSINGLCHHPHPTGYQHTKAAHALTTFNNWVVALLTGGEGFHHSHHWHQRTARFADTWWELPADWGYWLWIRPLEIFGKAKVNQRMRSS